MRVLFFLPTPDFYGDNIALMKVIPHLMEMGIEPLFLLAKNSDTEKQVLKKGYKCIYYYDMHSTLAPGKSTKAKYLFFKRKLKLFICFFRYVRLKKQVQEFNPQLIHSNNSAAELGFKLAKSLSIPHVWHIREYGLLDIGKDYYPSKRAFEKKLNAKNNYNITITKQIKNYFHLSDNNTKVVYDGVIDDTLSIPKCPLKEDFFLFVGRLVKTKGIHEIIHAFSEYHKNQPTTKLVIIGDSEDNIYKHQLKNLSHNLNLDNVVEFKGYQHNPYEWMARAKALIVASKFEAFGFITAESFFNGTIVIGKNTGGTKEQFDNMERICDKNIFYRYDNQSDLALRMISAAKTNIDKETVFSCQKAVQKMYSNRVSAKNVFEYFCKIARTEK